MSFNLPDIFGKIVVDTSKAEKGYERLQNKTQKFGKKSKASLGSFTDSVKKSDFASRKHTSHMESSFAKLGGSMSRILSKAGALGAMFGGGLSIGLVGVLGLKTASNLEQLALRLDVLSKGKGVETLQKLTKFSSKLPISVSEATGAFQRMWAYGIDPSIERLKTISNVAVLFGEDALRRVARALGQIQALGKVTFEELNQLSEVGINARKILRETFGKTIEEIQRTRVPIGQVIEALFKGMEEHSKGALKRARNTVVGQMTLMKNKMVEIVEIIGIELGAIDLVKEPMKAVNAELDTMTESIRKNKDAWGFWIDQLKTGLKELIGAAGRLWNFLKHSANVLSNLEFLQQAAGFSDKQAKKLLMAWEDFAVKHGIRERAKPVIPISNIQKQRQNIDSIIDSLKRLQKEGEDITSDISKSFALEFNFGGEQKPIGTRDLFTKRIKETLDKSKMKEVMSIFKKDLVLPPEAFLPKRLGRNLKERFRKFLKLPIEEQKQILEDALKTMNKRMASVRKDIESFVRNLPRAGKGISLGESIEIAAGQLSLVFDKLARRGSEIGKKVVKDLGFTIDVERLINIESIDKATKKMESIVKAQLELEGKVTEETKKQVKERLFEQIKAANFTEKMTTSLKKGTINALEKITEKTKESSDDQTQIIKGMFDTLKWDSEKYYNFRKNAIEMLFKKESLVNKKLATQAKDARMQQLNREQTLQTGTFGEGVKTFFGDFKRDSVSAAQLGLDTMNALENSLGQGMKELANSLIKRTESISEAFTNMAQTILSQMASFAGNQLIKQLFSSLGLLSIGTISTSSSGGTTGAASLSATSLSTASTNSTISTGGGGLNIPSLPAMTENQIVNVNMNIQANDVDSFNKSLRRSEGEVANIVSRAIDKSNAFTKKVSGNRGR